MIFICYCLESHFCFKTYVNIQNLEFKKLNFYVEKRDFRVTRGVKYFVVFVVANTKIVKQDIGERKR